MRVDGDLEKRTEVFINLFSDELGFLGGGKVTVGGLHPAPRGIPAGLRVLRGAEVALDAAGCREDR